MLSFLAKYHILLYLLALYGLILFVGFLYYPVKFFFSNIRIFIQKYISLFLSSVKIIDISKLNMFRGEARHLKKLLKPGDLLFSRRIGYLSNYFIPGYFSHAMIYLGTWKVFSRMFDKTCFKIYGIHINTFLRKRFPEIHMLLMHENNLILHVVREGVCIQGLTHETDFEGLCAIRTKMSTEALFKSILIAFENYGKDYDFSFDFESKEGLICSELLWTSFRKQTKKAGLKLRLNSLVDVKNISPSELLKQALYKNKQDFPVKFIFFLQYNLKQKILAYHCKKRLIKKLEEY